MALARTKAVAVAEPLPEAVPLGRPWAPHWLGRALPMAQVTEHETQLRRCTFRRLSITEGAGRSLSSRYAAECLYEGLEQPIPMGDLDRAWGICQRCTNTGIFRADED